MATIAPEIIPTPLDGPGLRLIRWTPLAAGDTCTPALVAPWNDKTVYFLKGAGFGGNMSLQGTVDPTAASGFLVLTDAQGNNIDTKAADCAENVEEGVYWIKPVVGAGVAGVSCWLVCQASL